MQPDVDPDGLILINETGASTKMAPALWAPATCLRYLLNECAAP